MLCLQTCQLEKSHAHFEKKTTNVCACEIQFFMVFADNEIRGVPSGAAEYSLNFWRTSHRKHFAGFIGLHLLCEGIQVRHNFSAEIKAEFPADAMCARSVPTASPPNRPIIVLHTVLCILRNPLKTTCLLWPLLSYLLTFLRSLRLLLNSSLGFFVDFFFFF